MTENQPYPLYELPRIANIKDMLEQKAAGQPAAIAFRYRKGRKEIIEKTFSDVRNETFRLAEYLQQKYGSGVHMAVIGENSYEWVRCFLAIVCSGNIAVPIDKGFLVQEVEELLEFADIQAVFCSDTYRDLVENTQNVAVYSLQQTEELSAEEETPELSVELVDSALACIFFTSGTSGKTKGVMLTHRNITEEINLTCQLFVLEGNTLALLPFHHAFGFIVGILMVYNYGYTTFINRSLKMLQADLSEAAPQTMFLVPLFIETFYKQIKKLPPQHVSAFFGGKLTYIISGGAGISPFYLEEYRKWGIEILNGYGTTECSACTAVNRNHYHKDGTVGVLIPGAQVRIAKDGEVFIKGPHVMAGYYKNPEATQKVFSDGWYRTGDLGQLDADGFLTLTGRKKNLIILSNGENISPEGIEADIGRHPAVNEVLVYGKDGVIVAEIFPEEKFLGNQEYFEELIAAWNHSRPIYKQIAKVILRDKDFIKNTSQKIVRYKNI